jgi:hypothetical protein
LTRTEKAQGYDEAVTWIGIDEIEDGTSGPEFHRAPWFFVIIIALL